MADVGIGPYDRRRDGRPGPCGGCEEAEAVGDKSKQTAATPDQIRKTVNAWAEAGTVRESLALKRKANALRKSMEASLQERGLNEQIYADMVSDYLELWWTRAELEDDIRKRGPIVMDEKRGLPVENCSVSARVRISAQMGKMYKAMGFQELAVKKQAPEDEDDAL